MNTHCSVTGQCRGFKERESISAVSLVYNHENIWPWPTVRWGGEHGKLSAPHYHRDNQQPRDWVLLCVAIVTICLKPSHDLLHHLNTHDGIPCTVHMVWFAIRKYSTAFSSVQWWYSYPDRSSRCKCQSFAPATDAIKCECLFTGVPARIFLNIYHSSLYVKVISLPLLLSDDS